MDWNSYFNNFDKNLREKLLTIGDVSSSEDCPFWELPETEYKFLINSYLNLNNLSFATIVSKQYLSHYPKSSDAVLEYCNTLIDNQLIDEAEQVINEKFDIVTPKSLASFIYCRIDIYRGALNEADEILSSAIKSNYDDFEIYKPITQIATDCYKRRYYAKAIEYFNLLSELNNTILINHYFLMALCYYKLRKYNDAISLLNKYLNVDTFNFEAWLTLGDIYSEKGDIENACNAYENAHLIDKQNLEALYKLGISNLTLDRASEAVKNFELLCEIKRNDIEGNLALASSYLALSDLKSAEFTFHKVLALQKDNQNALKGIEQIKKLRND